MGLLVPSILAAVVGAFIYQVPSLLPPSMDLFPAARDTSDGMRMTAIVYGSDGVLRIDEAFPRPKLKPNQVLIEMKAVGLNPVDFKLRRTGKSPVVPHPKIPGADVCGVIRQVGEKVRDWSVGDTVVAMAPLLFTPWGTLADFVPVDASYLAKVPSHLTNDLVALASMPLVSLTVIQAFQAYQGTTQSKKVLIQAGAGGVGSFAIQYAKKHLGMNVTTTASAENTEFVRSLGADMVIDYRSVPFEEVVQDYDIVLDPMSWLYENRTLQSGVLAKNGHYLSIVSSDWQWHGHERGNDVRQFWNSAVHKVVNMFVRGRLPLYTFVQVHPDGKQLQDAVDMVANGIIQPVVDRVFPFEEFEAAFAYLERGHTKGKVVIARNVVKDAQLL